MALAPVSRSGHWLFVPPDTCIQRDQDMSGRLTPPRYIRQTNATVSSESYTPILKKTGTYSSHPSTVTGQSQGGQQLKAAWVQCHH